MPKKSSKKQIVQIEEPKPILDIGKDIPNPQTYPWPKKDNSVYEVLCNDVFEFIPGPKRGEFMDELHRVLVPGGKATFNLRYWSCDASIQDYMYQWPPVSEKSFLYFNKEWREANKLKRPIKCDFDFSYGYVPEVNTANRSEDVRSHNLKYYTNVVQILQIVLTKK